MQHLRSFQAHLLGLLLLGFGAGCATSGSPSSPPSTVLPDESIQGTVVSVNAPLRYVVMDFSLRRLPALDQTLTLYRDGQKIGTVKISGPIMGTAAAGDIVTGQARAGDQVREEPVLPQSF